MVMDRARFRANYNYKCLFIRQEWNSSILPLFILTHCYIIEQWMHLLPTSQGKGVT